MNGDALLSASDCVFLARLLLRKMLRTGKSSNFYETLFALTITPLSIPRPKLHRHAA